MRARQAALKMRLCACGMHADETPAALGGVMTQPVLQLVEGAQEYGVVQVVLKSKRMVERMVERMVKRVPPLMCPPCPYPGCIPAGSQAVGVKRRFVQCCSRLQCTGIACTPAGSWQLQRLCCVGQWPNCAACR